MSSPIFLGRITSEAIIKYHPTRRRDTVYIVGMITLVAWKCGQRFQRKLEIWGNQIPSQLEIVIYWPEKCGKYGEIQSTGKIWKIVVDKILKFMKNWGKSCESCEIFIRSHPSVSKSWRSAHGNIPAGSCGFVLNKVRDTPNRQWGKWW